MYAKTHAHTNKHAHTLTVVDGVVLWLISMFVHDMLVLVFTLSTMTSLVFKSNISVYSTTLSMIALAVSIGNMCGYFLIEFSINVPCSLINSL